MRGTKGRVRLRLYRWQIAAEPGVPTERLVDDGVFSTGVKERRACWNPEYVALRGLDAEVPRE